MTMKRIPITEPSRATTNPSHYDVEEFVRHTYAVENGRLAGQEWSFADRIAAAMQRRYAEGHGRSWLSPERSQELVPSELSRLI